MKMKYDDGYYQAEDDVRTLIEAEKIKADKDRLRRATAKMREQRDALQKAMGKAQRSARAMS